MDQPASQASAVEFTEELKGFGLDRWPDTSTLYVLDEFGRLLLGRLWMVYGGQARASAGIEGVAERPVIEAPGGV